VIELLEALEAKARCRTTPAKLHVSSATETQRALTATPHIRNNRYSCLSSRSAGQKRGVSISVVLQQSLKNLDAAFNNFFEKRPEYPRFKSRKDKRCQIPL
jgi:transposase